VYVISYVAASCFVHSGCDTTQNGVTLDWKTGVEVQKKDSWKS